MVEVFVKCNLSPEEFCIWLTGYLAAGHLKYDGVRMANVEPVLSMLNNVKYRKKAAKVVCTGCDQSGVTLDDAGNPLCQDCYDELDPDAGIDSQKGEQRE